MSRHMLFLGCSVHISESREGPELPLLLQFQPSPIPGNDISLWGPKRNPKSHSPNPQEVGLAITQEI